MKFYMDMDYMVGRLRYGHIEGDIDFTEEEIKEFKELLKKDVQWDSLTEEESDKLDVYKERVLEHGSIKVDDYELYDYGEFHWEDLFEEETKITFTFEPVEDKPGYYWFNKRRCEIISEEVLKKAIKEYENSNILLLHD